MPHTARLNAVARKGIVGVWLAVALLAMASGILSGCRSTLPPSATHRDVESLLAKAAPAEKQRGNRRGQTADPTHDSLSEKIKVLTGQSASHVRPASHSDNGQPSGDHIHADPELLPSPNSAAGSLPSLQQLDELALANNPTLAAAQARVAAAHGKWIQAGLPPNPRFGYSGEEMGDDGTLGKQGGFIARQFVRGGKIELDQAVAAQEIARAEQELEVQRLRVLTDVRLAYYDFLVAARRMQLMETLLQQSQGISSDTKRLLEGGEAKRSDLLRAQIEERSIAIELRNAETEKQTAWQNLAAVVGSAERKMPDIDVSFQAFAKKQLDEALDRAIDRQQELDRILESSPEMAAARAHAEAARWSVERAYAEAVPDIDARLALQGDNVSGHMLVGVEVEFPIPICDRNQGGIQQAHAAVAAAEESANAIALDLRRRFEAAYQRFVNAKFQVDQYTKTGESDEEQGILAKANESIDLNRRLHLAGEINSLEMTVAQRAYTEANLSYLTAVRELWAAILEIDGMLLAGSFE